MVTNPERAKIAADNYRLQVKLADEARAIAATTSAESEALELLRSNLIRDASGYAYEVLTWGGALNDLKQENSTNG